MDKHWNYSWFSRLDRETGGKFTQLCLSVAKAYLMDVKHEVLTSFVTDTELKECATALGRQLLSEITEDQLRQELMLRETTGKLTRDAVADVVFDVIENRMGHEVELSDTCSSLALEPIEAAMICVIVERRLNCPLLDEAFKAAGQDTTVENLINKICEFLCV